MKKRLVLLVTISSIVLSGCGQYWRDQGLASRMNAQSRVIQAETEREASAAAAEVAKANAYLPALAMIISLVLAVTMVVVLAWVIRTLLENKKKGALENVKPDKVVFLIMPPRDNGGWSTQSGGSEGRRVDLLREIEHYSRNLPYPIDE